MDKKNLLYVGIGVVVGYFVISYMKKAKENQLTSPSTSIDDQTKVENCKKQVDEFMATAKFGAGADLDAIRKEQFDACMKA